MKQHWFSLSSIQDLSMVHSGCLPEFKFLTLEGKTLFLQFSFHFSFKVSFFLSHYTILQLDYVCSLEIFLFLCPIWSSSSCSPEYLLTHLYLMILPSLKLYGISLCLYLNSGNVSWYDLYKTLFIYLTVLHFQTLHLLKYRD